MKLEEAMKLYPIITTHTDVIPCWYFLGDKFIFYLPAHPLYGWYGEYPGITKSIEFGENEESAVAWLIKDGV